MTAQKKSVFFKTIAAFALTVLFLSGCARSEDGSEERGKEATLVEVAEVKSRTIRDVVNEIGTVEASEKVVLRPETGGKIEKISFREGRRVGAGQQLFEIESEELRQEVKAARSGLEGAKATLKKTEKDYQRINNLFSRGLMPEQRLDEARNALKSAKARVEELRARVRQARERYSDIYVHAPDTGVVGELMVDTGNLVSPGEPLAEFYITNPFEVSFTVPERYANRVRSGQKVLVSPAADSGRKIPGEVSFVSPTVGKSTRSLLVKARVNQSDGDLFPGGFSQVELILGKRSNRPVVPAEALVTTRDGYMVFRVIDGKVEARDVEIGQRLVGSVEITEGLVPGEKIVSSGHMQLSDGDSIKRTTEETE